MKTNPLAKYAALQKAAEKNGGSVRLANVNVTFFDRVNQQGVQQYACTMCGDCNTGCNYGAKNTLLMNYLPDAKNHGASIFCGVNVQTISQADPSSGGWQVNCIALPDPNEPTKSSLTNPIPLTVTADVVILGAGAVGSTEILLRSKKNGLPVSDCVGKYFGGKCHLESHFNSSPIVTLRVFSLLSVNSKW